AMVDRITPRPTDVIGERVRLATGRSDKAAIMAETFIQWVIEDSFIAGRPQWEAVGGEMVSDVTPYEAAKIRILNASHSAIGWAGSLAGYTMIDEGARNPRIRRIVHSYITSAVFPCLMPSPVDLPRYRDTVLDRFGNVALGDTNQRIVQMSYTKLGGFIAPTVTELLDTNQDISDVAVLPALYLAFLREWRAGRMPIAYEEPPHDLATASMITDAADPVLALCRLQPIWGRHAGQPRLIDAVRAAAADVAELVRLD
ncbi:MAG: hypothetical protein ACRCYS_17120, partial [Beijerinckiaceae bacterium]